MSKRNCEVLNQHKVHDGELLQVSHWSAVLNCAMRLSVFLPPVIDEQHSVPAVYWLSGLTCTDENFAQKSGAFRTASELGLALIIPDTSPRGETVPDDEQGHFDLGLGAGFYVNATQEPWKKHYKMYDYIVYELPDLIESNFPVSDKRSIFGHSMGGHGALVIALRNPRRFNSVSAFSPICNPINAPWGQKAFSAYLGENKSDWRQYDACELIAKATTKMPMMIQVGTKDEFIETQLKPQALASAAHSNDFPIEMHYADGYDHTYFFISTFIEQHLKFHAAYL